MNTAILKTNKAASLAASIKSFAFAVLAAVTVAAPAQAQLIGPQYPPPGGVVFSGSGAGPGRAGGRTNTYSNLDQSQYNALYWGPSPNGLQFTYEGDTNGNGNAYDDKPGETLTFSSMSGNLASWTGESELKWHNGSSFVFSTVLTRLDAVLTDLSNNPINWMSAGSLGLSNVGAVGPITGTGFKANFTMYARDPRNLVYTPVDQLFDSLNTDPSSPIYNQSRRSLSFGFYSQAVPEPGTWAALAGIASVGGLALLRRRSRK
jgi:hypothetical protein